MKNLEQKRGTYYTVKENTFQTKRYDLCNCLSQAFCPQTKMVLHLDALPFKISKNMRKEGKSLQQNMYNMVD